MDPADSVGGGDRGMRADRLLAEFLLFMMVLSYRYHWSCGDADIETGWCPILDVRVSVGSVFLCQSMSKSRDISVSPVIPIL